jgi:hypothetical protein
MESSPSCSLSNARSSRMPRYMKLTQTNLLAPIKSASWRNLYLCVWSKVLIFSFSWSTVLLQKLTGLKLVKNSPHFMEPESWLPHSQVPATCLYPGPAQSSPYPISHFLKIHLNIILPSSFESPKWFRCFTFSHQYPVHASPPYALHAPPI